VKTRNRNALIVFGLFYFGFGVWLTIHQERFIYRPHGHHFGACMALAKSETLVHNGTRLYITGTTQPVVVLYHGNAGSACDRAWYERFTTAAGYDLALVEYTGYGGDMRRPTHAQVKNDVHNVIAYLQEQQRPIAAVIGESIGSGPASYHTRLAPPPKLLLITPFTDLVSLVSEHVWFYPTSLLVNNAFRPINYLASYRGHVTIVHGTEDTVAPITLGRDLYDALSTEDKKFIRVYGADHNDLFLFADSMEAIKNFLSKE